jgi:hypothetical protein
MARQEKHERAGVDGAVGQCGAERADDQAEHQPTAPT